MSEARAGHCVSIDGEWWHEPGTCPGPIVNCDGKCCTAPAQPGGDQGGGR